jgi:hypothetical protein
MATGQVKARQKPNVLVVVVTIVLFELCIVFPICILTLRWLNDGR